MVRHSLHHLFFFFNDTATTEIYTLSLHDALPISHTHTHTHTHSRWGQVRETERSEEHTSELQSHLNLVCRLLLEKKTQQRQTVNLLRSHDLCASSLTRAQRTRHLSASVYRSGAHRDFHSLSIRRCFFFNDTATTEIYTLSLHDALPIWHDGLTDRACMSPTRFADVNGSSPGRSEEHTSELQSHLNLVCRLLLEKKK